MAMRVGGNLLDNMTSRQAIVDAVRQGVPPTAAMLAAGYSEGIYKRYLEAERTGYWPSGDNVSAEYLTQIRSFLEEIRGAIALMEQDRILRIAEAGKSVNSKTGIPEWRADAWLLERHPATRQSYFMHRPQQDITVTRVSPERAELRQLPPEKLIDLVPSEWRELVEEPKAMDPEQA